MSRTEEFSRPLPWSVAEKKAALEKINRDLLAALGLLRGVSHAEFIRAHEYGHFYFLECAARVGGAYINEMVEAASDINLWREWARIEVAGGDGTYKLPTVRKDYAGVILAGTPGKSGHFRLQRSGGCSAHHQTSSRWIAAQVSRPGPHSGPLA